MRWTLSLIILLIFLAPLLAAGACGDGVCGENESCSLCSSDCGGCNGASCSFDNDCYSDICCSGVCSSSCVIYPPAKSESSPYVAWVLRVGSYSTTIGLVYLGIMALIIILVKAKVLKT
jgi:hypothetical protein